LGFWLTYPDSVALCGSAIRPRARDSRAYESGSSVRDGKAIGNSRKVAAGRRAAENKGKA